MRRKIVIIGGVAGGAACATRLRRLNEDDEITMIEKGEYISFANCALPYYIGGVIEGLDEIIIQTPKEFEERFNIKVHTLTEAIKIDRERKRVVLKDLRNSSLSEIEYDILILSPGAFPLRPPLPGIDDERIFTLRTISDGDRIKKYIENHRPKEAVVVGGGFIGLEVSENLTRRGIKTTIIEKLTQVMPNLDPEIARILERHAVSHNVGLKLGSGITGFERANNRLVSLLENGEKISSDMAILAIGIRPETKIARDAGIDTEKNGAIIVDQEMRTSDPNIFAIGDAVVTKNPITDTKWGIALAGPAAKQARVVADAINNRNSSYAGAIGTSVVKFFELTVASVGCSEKYLNANQITYSKCYIHPFDHASYYPGATPMTIKLIFNNENGKIYGGEIVGTKGVDKRIDVIASAIHAGLSVMELKDLDLAYAPPYGSSKDPVNMAALVASNIVEGLSEVVHWHDIPSILQDGENYLLLDVRTDAERALGTIEGSSHIPIDKLRANLNKLPKDKTIVVFCQVGYRGYLAERILKQHGYKVKNLSGGYKTYIESIG